MPPWRGGPKAAYKRSNTKRMKDPTFRRQKVVAENLRRRRIQAEAIDHYGGKCYCCGETIKLFLSLDHTNGGGCQHRKELKGMRVAGWAKNNGWPPIFRVACHNCNFGAHLNHGVCPHKVGG